MHNFVSIKEAFDNEPNLANVRKIVKQSEVVEKFYDIFPSLENIVLPKRVERETWLLNVENPTLRNELKFNEGLLMEKINKFFHEERIKSIRFI